MLKDLKDTSKHVILLSDGDTHSADFKMMIDRIRSSGVTLSTVTIGEDGDPDLMIDLSVWGGGRNYKARVQRPYQKFLLKKLISFKEDDLINEFQISENLKFDAIDSFNFDEFPKLSNYSIAKEKIQKFYYTLMKATFLSRWNYGLEKCKLSWC